MSKEKKNRMRPLWMPLYVEKFLADTGALTPSQVGAYVRLLCAMWRSDDGTLPNHDTQLARSGGVGPNNWWRVWPAIKHLFDTDGDRVTNTDLQAELGKANALLVTKRAVAALGGQATQFRRTIQREPLEKTLTPPKPLKSLNGVQASAQANYNYNLKKEKEPLPLPRKGEASGSEARGGNLSANPSLPSLEENQKASTEVPVKLSHSESPLESALQNWGAAFRKRNG